MNKPAEAPVAQSAPLPLSQITVLDLTLARAGPTCVRHLADWGADVIRVEPPSTGGEDVVGRRNGSDFQNLHRNKRAIQLNLKSPEGYKVFMKLVEKADVLIENMRAPVKGRLKIAYDDLKKVNLRLVYGSISGFGQTGPYGKRAGVDQIVQGMGGLMSVTGLPGQGPVRVGVAIADLTAGNLLALGVMTALFDREKTGVGRWVHTSLLESIIFMLDFQATRYLVAGEVAGQAGNDHPTSVPTGVFPASDGLFNIAASSARVFHRCCDALGKPEWKTKAEWDTQQKRSKVRADINAAISEITKHKPTAHWVEVMEAAGVPCGPINTIDKVFADPQVKHLGIATPIDHPKYGKQTVVGQPIHLSRYPQPEKLKHTPDCGEHTDEVLKGLGYDAAAIAALRAKGAV